MYGESKAVLQQFLKQFPSDRAILFQLGTICIELKEYTEARSVLQTAVDANPDDEDLLVNYGEFQCYTYGLHACWCEMYMSRCLAVPLIVSNQLNCLSIIECLSSVRVSWV